MTMKPRVLVVDDDPDEMSPCVELLRANYDVKVESNSRKLEEYFEWDPDVVVLDISMQPTNGLQCAKMLRQAGLDCEIIFATGFAEGADRAIIQSLDVDASFFLRKPFAPSVLRSVVRRSVANQLLRRDREDERQLAVSMQKLLRPESSISQLGVTVSWAQTSAADLCGDAVDVAIREGKVFSLIADAMGHGTRAALLTPMLHTVFRAVVDQGGRLDDIGSALRTTAEKLPSGMFVTCVIVVIDTESGSGEYLSFGHPSMLYIEDDVVHSLDVNNPLLGVGGTDALAKGIFRMEAGSSLVGFTDGVTESRDGLDQMLGQKGVEVLALELCGEEGGESPSQQLLQQVLERSGGTLMDDASVMWVRRK